MKKKILHILSQRPSRTGSGITLDSLVRIAREKGYEQRVIVGSPAEDARPNVGGLPDSSIHPLLFEKGKLDFPLPGMSDVMPYRSSVWSSLTKEQLQTYREEWKSHLQEVIADFTPDLIHSHHIWILSSIIKDVCPQIPVLSHCHATGLRQMVLCLHEKAAVVKGCSRNEAFFVLHDGHGENLRITLNKDEKAVVSIGAGYRADIFNCQGLSENNSEVHRLVYVGKYSHSKGLPSLLDAIERLNKGGKKLKLHVVGSGAGPEAEALKERMESMGGLVKLHGQLAQPQLAVVLKASDLFILPSFFEGLPLVLAEAAACGCRLICTRLPGVEKELYPHLKEILELVELPRMKSIDQPCDDELPAFTENIERAIELSLSKGKLTKNDRQLVDLLRPFTWEAIFEKVEKIWLSFLD